MNQSSGILSALGAFFGGYAQDDERRKQQAAQAQKFGLEQQNAARDDEFRRAQIANMETDNAARMQSGQRAQLNQQTIADSWDAALNGDRQAQARIVSIDPTLAPHFMPKPKEAKDPIMGSPEWRAAKEYEKQLDAKYRAPTQAPAMVHTGFDQQGRPVFVDPRDPNRTTTAPVVTKPADGMTPIQANQVKVQQSALLNMQKAVMDLRDAVAKDGMALFGGKHAADIASKQTQAMMQFKEAANLGALSGPDMQLMLDAIGSGTSVKQAVFRGGKDGVLQQLDNALSSISQRAGTMEQIYGARMPEEFYRNASSNAPKPPTMAPRDGVAPTAPNDQRQPARLSPEKLRRAQTDSAYRQFLKETGQLR